MVTQQKSEKSLHQLLAARREITDLGGRVAPGAHYGTLVILGDRPLGLWSILDDQYVFRELCNYEPAITVACAAEAVDVTIALLTLCRQGWAERFGPINIAQAAA
jgi:hypothetical protein